MTAYRINESELSHNFFDGELIAIHLPTGVYFSLHDAAAQIWTWMEQGPVTAESLAAAFVDAPAEAGDQLEDFLQSLAEQKLVVACDEPVNEKFAKTPVPYSKPTLEPFNDLTELLKADIIHDTNEQGWPELSVTD